MGIQRIRQRNHQSQTHNRTHVLEGQGRKVKMDTELSQAIQYYFTGRKLKKGKMEGLLAKTY